MRDRSNQHPLLYQGGEFAKRCGRGRSKRRTIVDYYIQQGDPLDSPFLQGATSISGAALLISLRIASSFFGVESLHCRSPPPLSHLMRLAAFSRGVMSIQGAVSKGFHVSKQRIDPLQVVGVSVNLCTTKTCPVVDEFEPDSPSDGNPETTDRRALTGFSRMLWEASAANWPLGVRAKYTRAHDIGLDHRQGTVHQQTTVRNRCVASGSVVCPFGSFHKPKKKKKKVPLARPIGTHFLAREKGPRLWVTRPFARTGPHVLASFFFFFFAKKTETPRRSSTTCPQFIS